MAIKTSKKRELDYASYKTANKFSTNRKKKLTRLLKKYPNNTQIAKALADIRGPRTTPKTEVWSHSMISAAKLFKLFTGKFSKDVFSADTALFSAAIRTRNQNAFDAYKAPESKYKSMFSLMARAHTSNGVNAWM